MKRPKPKRKRLNSTKVKAEAVVTKALDEIGQALKEKGITLEELRERGRIIIGELIEKEYGLSGKSS